MNRHILCIALIATGVFATGCLPESEDGETHYSSGGTGAAQPDFTTVPDTSSGGEGGAPDEPPQVPPIQAGDEGIIINNGDEVASSSALGLTIYKYEALKMKVSPNANCDGGEWVDYAEDAVVNLGESSRNQQVYVSARFKDYDLADSDCYSSTIIHDDAGPSILFAKYPTSALQDNEATEIIYDVYDLGVGVDKVECSLNGIVRPCGAGRTVVNIPGAAPGTYIFEVVATDKLGFESRKSTAWQVLESARKVTHNIKVDEYRKWDILFVIDNSGSMAYEQKSMADRTKNFLAVMRGLDWQIAITTTDQNHSKFGDGRFLELVGRPGEYLLKSSMTEDQAQYSLSQTLQRKETGSSSEQGIRSTYRVVERGTANEGTIYTQFFREGAHFAVVLISDEDESANTAKNDPQGLLDLVTGRFSAQKNFSFNSIIAIPGDRACLNGQGATAGERYKIMTALTNGVMGSVCELDYAAQMTGIAERVRGMAKTFTLACAPLPEYGISIKRDGVVVTEPYTVDGLKLNFSQSIDPGQYELVYHCLK